MAGTLKIIYDLFLYRTFVAVRRPEEARQSQIGDKVWSHDDWVVYINDYAVAPKYHRGFELTVCLCRREENLGSKVGAAFKLRNGIE